jgi:hypothetical protein
MPTSAKDRSAAVVLQQVGWISRMHSPVRSTRFSSSSRLWRIPHSLYTLNSQTFDIPSGTFNIRVEGRHVLGFGLECS